MSGAHRQAGKDTWIGKLAHAVAEPWRTMLLIMLTFLALAFFSTVQIPTSAPNGDFYVTFTPSSWPDSAPPNPAAESLPSVRLLLATESLTLPCFGRFCGIVTAKGSYGFVGIDSKARIHPALVALSAAATSAKMPAFGYVDRRNDSTMTVVLSPGSADSLTIYLRSRRHGTTSYYVGPTCVRACTTVLPIKAFAFATRA